MWAPVRAKCESLLLSLLLGKEDALAHFAKYHPAFDEASGDGWLPLHKAAVQLNKSILEITLNGKLLSPLWMLLRNKFISAS